MRAATPCGLPAPISCVSGLIGLSCASSSSKAFRWGCIAFGKVDGKARKLPGGQLLNAGAAALSLVLLLMYVNGSGVWTLIAFFIGYHLIMGI